MSEPDILYPAIFVFSMLLIGLLLTMWEFSRLNKRQQHKAGSDKRVSDPGIRASRDSAKFPVSDALRM
jgi:hypothetical protein